MKKIKIKKILKKKGKKPIVCLTAYSSTMAKILDKFCDIILVGDSVSMVLYGMKTTKEIKIDTLILHAKAVKKMCKRSLVVFDMPYNTYQSKTLAFKNAKKVIKQTNCDAIKLEGGKKITNIVKHLVKNNIPVMGHIGLLPQTSKDFKVKGKNKVQQNKISKNTLVPTIGIGASRFCDGQILVTDDIIGMSNFQPRFVKQYSKVGKIIEQSVKNYCTDVIKGKFPTSRHAYKN